MFKKQDLLHLTEEVVTEELKVEDAEAWADGEDDCRVVMEDAVQSHQEGLEDQPAIVQRAGRTESTQPAITGSTVNEVTHQALERFRS